MEGISGIISFDSQSNEIRSKIKLMTGVLSDGEQLNITAQCGGNWALACGGWQGKYWQPLTFLHRDEKLAIVGIADVHNRSDLAKIYRLNEDKIGDIFIACYKRDKKEWPLQIRGNFAVIILDFESQQFIAATDRIGIRPLYWYKQENVYYMSSRLSPIRKVCESLEIDETAVYAYMHHSMIPSPYTIYKNVYKLEPGHFLKADEDQHKLEQYWDISTSPKLAENEKEVAEKVYQTIEDAVSVLKNGIAAETELGCFLSGGTDSSSICGLLSKKVHSQVAAYSIGFPETGYDEMFFARTAAQAFDLEHHELYIEPHDVLELLPQIVAAYDEPFGNASAIPTHFCARKAAQNGINYMLAGDGGDEIFAGNERYAGQQIFRNYFRIPELFRTGLLEPVILNRLERIPLTVFRKAGSYIRRAKMPEVERLDSYRYVTDQQMFAPSFLESCDMATVRRISEDHFTALDGASPLDRHLYLDMKLTITDNDLRKVTRMCELAHVRVRYPMLDYPVVELGFQIPAEMKLRGTNGLRYIFKRAFRNLLPQEILSKSKWGFGLPISQWLRENQKIRNFAYDLLFDSKHLNREYFQSNFIEKLWGLHLTDKTPYFGTIIWQLVMLEAWHRVHFIEEGF